MLTNEQVHNHITFVHAGFSFHDAGLSSEHVAKYGLHKKIKMLNISLIVSS